MVFLELVFTPMAMSVTNMRASEPCESQCEPYERVSMGLTVSRKTAKNLAVRRKNERILTVSRKKC